MTTPVRNFKPLARPTYPTLFTGKVISSAADGYSNERKSKLLAGKPLTREEQLELPWEHVKTVTAKLKGLPIDSCHEEEILGYICNASVSDQTKSSWISFKIYSDTLASQTAHQLLNDGALRGLSLTTHEWHLSSRPTELLGIEPLRVALCWEGAREGTWCFTANELASHKSEVRASAVQGSITADDINIVCVSFDLKLRLTDTEPVRHSVCIANKTASNCVEHAKCRSLFVMAANTPAAVIPPATTTEPAKTAPPTIPAMATPPPAPAAAKTTPPSPVKADAAADASATSSSCVLAGLTQPPVQHDGTAMIKTMEHMAHMARGLAKDSNTAFATGFQSGLAAMSQTSGRTVIAGPGGDEKQTASQPLSQAPPPPQPAAKASQPPPPPSIPPVSPVPGAAAAALGVAPDAMAEEPAGGAGEDVGDQELMEYAKQQLPIDDIARSTLQPRSKTFILQEYMRQRSEQEKLRAENERLQQKLKEYPTVLSEHFKKAMASKGFQFAPPPSAAGQFVGADSQVVGKMMTSKSDEDRNAWRSAKSTFMDYMRRAKSQTDASRQPARQPLSQSSSSSPYASASHPGSSANPFGGEDGNAAERRAKAVPASKTAPDTGPWVKLEPHPADHNSQPYYVHRDILAMRAKMASSRCSSSSSVVTASRTQMFSGMNGVTGPMLASPDESLAFRANQSMRNKILRETGCEIHADGRVTQDNGVPIPDNVGPLVRFSGQERIYDLNEE